MVQHDWNTTGIWRPLLAIVHVYWLSYRISRTYQRLKGLWTYPTIRGGIVAVSVARSWVSCDQSFGARKINERRWHTVEKVEL